MSLSKFLRFQFMASFEPLGPLQTIDISGELQFKRRVGLLARRMS